MQYSVKNGTQIEKLKNILTERFGKTVLIRPLSDISAMRNLDTPFIKGADLHIPIQSSGSYLGTAVVPAALDLKIDQKNEVSELVKMVLEPTLYEWYLSQRENNIRELSKVDLDIDNVRVFGDIAPTDEEYSIELMSLNERHSASLVSHIVHLHGNTPTLIKKAALQLHEITGRWAFVPFADIKGQLHSSLDIARMGNMTIFIEEISNLNAADIEFLQTYLEEDVQADTPLIITASSQDIRELRSSDISSNFLDELEINEFDMSHAPVDHNRLREVLELFFLQD